jgi:hypothetical protein
VPEVSGYGSDAVAHSEAMPGLGKIAAPVIQMMPVPVNMRLLHVAKVPMIDCYVRHLVANSSLPWPRQSIGPHLQRQPADVGRLICGQWNRVFALYRSLLYSGIPIPGQSTTSIRARGGGLRNMTSLCRLSRSAGAWPMVTVLRFTLVGDLH